MEATPPKLQLVLAQESLAGELQTALSNAVHDVFGQVFKTLVDVPVGENFQNKEIERAKEEMNRFLEEVSAYKMDSKKVEKMLLNNKAAIKPITLSLVDPKGSAIRLKKEKHLLIKINKELLSI